MFSITCETCASRLKVKNPSAIGQVLACPRCGSMVQVVAPEGWDSESTESELPPDETAIAKATASSVRTRRSAKSSAGSKKRSTASASQSASPAQAEASQPPASTEPILPNDAWTSVVNRKRRRTLLWMVAFTSLCLLATITIAVFAYQLIQGSGQNQNSQAQNTATHPEADDSADNSTDQNKRGATSQDPASPNPAEKNQPEKNPPKNVDKEKRPDAQSPEKNGDSDKEDTTSPPAVPAQPDSNQNTDSTTSDQTPGANGPSVGPRPLPESPKESPFGAPLSDDEASPSPMGVPDSLLDGLGPMADFILNPGIDLDQLPSGTSIYREPLGHGSTFIPKPKIKKRDLEKELNASLTSIRIPRMSLLHAVRFFENLTGIPVQFDTKSVMSGRIAPHFPVEVKASEITTQELLKLILDQAQLTYHVNPDSKVIYVVPLEPTDLIPIQYPIPTPFQSEDPEQQAELRDKLKQMLQSTVQPWTWTIEEAPGTIAYVDGQLTVSQTLDVHRELERFLLLLEAAYRFQQDPHDQQTQQILFPLSQFNSHIETIESSFRHLQAQPIYDVLRQIEEQDGITILVNWDALYFEGWYSNTEITWPSLDPFNEQKTFEDTLSDVMLSMRLSFHSVAPNTLEISTFVQTQNTTRLEIYPLDSEITKHFSSDHVMLVLENQLKPRLPQYEFTRVFYQDESNAIVAVLPETLHHHLQGILDALRSAKR